MLLKRLLVGMLAVSGIFGAELQAITMTTPSNGLTSPAMIQEASGSCVAYNTVALDITFKALGTLVYLPHASKSQSSSSSGTYQISISSMVWTASGSYKYKASQWANGATATITNTCTIP